MMRVVVRGVGFRHLRDNTYLKPLIDDNLDNLCFRHLRDNTYLKLYLQS